MTTPKTVFGLVRLREAISQPGGVLRVKLEDVSRIDAAARLIVEVAVPITHPLDAESELPFTLVVPDVDDSAHYNVRAHVDMTGSGMISPGDRVSTVAHPVLTQGYPNEVTIEAREV